MLVSVGEVKETTLGLTTITAEQKEAAMEGSWGSDVLKGFFCEKKCNDVLKRMPVEILRALRFSERLPFLYVESVDF